MYPHDGYHENQLDALGKGKGKFGKGAYGKATGKGANAQCYVCGETGHLSYDCPKGKGKGGKGKGKTLTCWNCGEEGHPHFMCPHGGGKGKGKPWGTGPQWPGKGAWGKATGKGAYQIETEWPALGEWQGEPNPSAETGLGGGEISEVQQWQVKVARTRVPGNMRPARRAPANPTTIHANRFGSLQTDDDDGDDVVTGHGRDKSGDRSMVTSKAPRWTRKTAKVAENRSETEANYLDSVDVNRPQEIGVVTMTTGEWERIPVKIDSGAIDTVMPPSVGNYFGLAETVMSRKGPGFRAANGTAIKHYGQRTMRGTTDQYKPINMTAQVADVKTTLGSVNQMLKAGNRVHFETGNCYIEHVPTGVRTEILEKNGTFEVGIWVPKSGNQQRCNEVSGKPNGNRAATENSSFHGQDEQF